MYQLLRSLLFLFDAEDVHYFSMNALKLLCKVELIKKWFAKEFTPNTQPSYLNFPHSTLSFKNPIGLGAGFDKNAVWLNELEALGFGFVEIGTVTPLPQNGNEKPRLFRLPKDKALINRMGFNNHGADVVAERLKRWKMQKSNRQWAIDGGLQTTDNQQPATASTRNPQPLIASNPKPQTPNLKLIIGGNIGKNKNTPNEDAWKDYEICFNKLHDCVDYFVVNVSSPNTPGLRELQEKKSLQKILVTLQNSNENFKIQKPIFLKIAPDLSLMQIDEVIELALEIKLDGLIIANTTISRENLKTDAEGLNKIGPGGLSGKPLAQRSKELVKYIKDKTQGKIKIIASGGIFTASDANDKMNAGACLLQVWTGFIYEGPGIVRNICPKI